MKSGIRAAVVLTAIITGAVAAEAHPHDRQDGPQQRRRGQDGPQSQMQQRQGPCRPQMQQQGPRDPRPPQVQGRQDSRQFSPQSRWNEQRRPEMQNQRPQGQNQPFQGRRGRSQFTPQRQGQRGPQMQQYGPRSQGQEFQCRPQLSPEQRQQILQKRRQILKRFDADCDGRLSDKERKKIKKAWKQHQNGKDTESPRNPAPESAE